MFIVIMTSGQYDTFNTMAVASSASKDKAELYASEKNKVFASVQEKYVDYNKAEQEWRESNPAPKFCPPKNFTSLSEEVQKSLVEEWRPSMQEWQAKITQFTQNWMEQNLTSEERLIFSVMDNNYWSVQEVMEL